MRRIAILGNSAGGKSTLARHLSDVSGITQTEIDQLYWSADWEPTPSEVYQRAHDDIIRNDKWIIDGVGDLPSVQRRAERATDLILIDLPLWVHFWRAAERQMAWAQGTIEHAPGGGGQEMPQTQRLFEMIWQMDRDWMPVLRSVCDDQEKLGKNVVCLTTLEQLDGFTALGQPDQ